jgi:hypothetical protein
MVFIRFETVLQKIELKSSNVAKWFTPWYRIWNEFIK